MLLELLLDVIIILILVLGSYFGYTRGFFRMVARPMRLVLCLAVSLGFCRAAGESLILPLVEGPITNYISEYLTERSTDVTVEKIPTVMKIAAVLFDIPIDFTADSSEEMIEQIISSLAAPAIKMISVALAFIILFLLMRIAYNFLVDIADSFLSLGIIGSLNRFFGVVLSCGLAFIIAWLFAQSIDLLFRSSRFEDSDIIRSFKGGPLYGFFISFGPLRLLLTF